MRLACLILCLCIAAPVWAQESDSIDLDEAGETVDLGTYSGEYEEVKSSHQLMPPDELQTTRTYQSEDLPVKKFDKARWRQIVGSTDFNEEASKEPETEDQAGEFSLPWAGPLLKVFSYVIIIGVVMLLLYLVLKNVTFDLRIRRAQLQNEQIENGVENIEDVDIKTLLDQARSSANFRVAIRLYYLGLLKKLHELNVIVWKKDKTNHDYLSELYARDFYFEDVRGLTRSYEAVWYGEHSLQPEAFEALSARFETIYQKMNNPPAE